MKIAFRQVCDTVCGRLGPNEGGVVGYVDRMRAKYTAKWGVQMAGMNFQTRSRVKSVIRKRTTRRFCDEWEEKKNDFGSTDGYDGTCSDPYRLRSECSLSGR